QVTYSATVKTQSPSTVAPVTAGTVTFVDNGTPIGSPVTVNSTTGIAAISVTYNSLSLPGSHTITATYNAPTATPINYASSPPLRLTQTVLKGAAMAVTPTPAAPIYGQSINLGIAITATSPSTGTPDGGTVTVKEGSTILGAATLVN